MKKVLVIQPLRPEALALFDERADISYEVVTDFSPANLLRHVDGVDAITIRDAPLPVEVVNAATDLAIVSRHGVGYDNVPVEVCTARNIPVTVVGPVNAISVAEQAMFLMLAAAKAGVALDTRIRAGDFAARSRIQGIQLSGRTLLIVGYGNIGQEVAERARAFAMKIIAFDPYADRQAFPGVRFAETLEAGLKEADVVSLHVPLTDATRNLLASKELDLLPASAIVINTARGGLIDEEALLARVKSGRLHGAGLDTFVEEPLPHGHPITTDERIVLSPHSSALTDESLLAMGMMTARNALAGLDGNLDPNLVINKSVLAPGKTAGQ